MMPTGEVTVTICVQTFSDCTYQWSFALDANIWPPRLQTLNIRDYSVAELNNISYTIPLIKPYQIWSMAVT